MTIIIQQPIRHSQQQTITIAQAQKWRMMRRRRVVKRLLKRCPLFAVEEMQHEFPGYTYNDLLDDIQFGRKPKKHKPKKVGKSPLKRQGRFTLMQKALSDWRITQNIESLYQAQTMRNRLYKDFMFVWKLSDGTGYELRMPSTTSMRTVEAVKNIKGTDIEDIKAQIKSITKYDNCN